MNSYHPLVLAELTTQRHEELARTVTRARGAEPLTVRDSFATVRVRLGWRLVELGLRLIARGSRYA